MHWKCIYIKYSQANITEQSLCTALIDLKWEGMVRLANIDSGPEAPLQGRLESMSKSLPPQSCGTSCIYRKCIRIRRRISRSLISSVKCYIKNIFRSYKNMNSKFHLPITKREVIDAIKITVMEESLVSLINVHDTCCIWVIEAEKVDLT